MATGNAVQTEAFEFPGPKTQGQMERHGELVHLDMLSKGTSSRSSTGILNLSIKSVRERFIACWIAIKIQ